MPLQPLELSAWQAAQLRDAALRAEPERKKAHGIVHTPPQLARAVVQLADELLTTRFGLPQGIRDQHVQLIDPACGPGAFLAAALALAETQGAAADWRLLGLDLDQGALSRCQELLAPSAGDRLRLVHADLLRDGTALSAHVDPARVLAIVGNPPWASVRAQPTAAAQALLEDFRRDEHGQRLAERKLGVLADAYVRFFRVCAEVARSSPAGALLALVTNSSFLDGPNHRGMRAALLRWFDDLFVIDLGGSALVQRNRGVRDDNVFGVRPGVAVTLLCCYPQPRKPHAKRAQYAQLAGDRTHKLERLCEAKGSQLPFVPLAPESPWWRFKPARAVAQDYGASWSLAECMPFHREGVQSNRDAIVIDADPARLLARLHAFVREGSRAALEPGLAPSHHFDPALARRQLAAALERDPDGTLGISLRRIDYRPWDTRYYCPVAPLCHRPRPELQQAVESSSWSLVSVRKDRGQGPWSHASASRLIIDNCLLSARSSCRARAFPLHTAEGQENLAPTLQAHWSDRLGAAVCVRDFAAYALALLCGARYRARHDEALRHDYPRILLPPTAAAFQVLAGHGRQLLALLADPVLPSDAEIDMDIDMDMDMHASEGALYRDLVIDAEHGCVRLQGSIVLEASVAALGLRIGHYMPLTAYCAARRTQPLDRAGLAAIRARALRLEQLVAACARLDRSVCELLPSLAS